MKRTSLAGGLAIGRALSRARFAILLVGLVYLLANVDLAQKLATALGV